MKDREKELRYLLYLKEQLLKETKKEIKEIQRQIEMEKGYKTLERKKKRK